LRKSSPLQLSEKSRKKFFKKTGEWSTLARHLLCVLGTRIALDCWHKICLTRECRKRKPLTVNDLRGDVENSSPSGEEFLSGGDLRRDLRHLLRGNQACHLLPVSWHLPKQNRHLLRRQCPPCVHLSGERGQKPRVDTVETDAVEIASLACGLLILSLSLVDFYERTNRPRGIRAELTFDVLLDCVLHRGNTI